METKENAHSFGQGVCADHVGFDTPHGGEKDVYGPAGGGDNYEGKILEFDHRANRPGRRQKPVKAS